MPVGSLGPEEVGIRDEWTAPQEPEAAKREYPETSEIGQREPHPLFDDGSSRRPFASTSRRIGLDARAHEVLWKNRVLSLPRSRAF